MQTLQFFKLPVTIYVSDRVAKSRVFPGKRGIIKTTSAHFPDEVKQVGLVSLHLIKINQIIPAGSRISRLRRLVVSDRAIPPRPLSLPERTRQGETAVTTIGLGEESGAFERRGTLVNDSTTLCDRYTCVALFSFSSR